LAITVKPITATATIPLRHRVLRAGLPISTCQFAGDDALETFHFGGFANDELVCIASVMRQAETRFGLFEGQFAFQLRGMASDEAVRGQGFGTAVLDACLRETWSRGAAVLWCNARREATGFYQKQGFTLHPPQFEIPTAGVHQVMYRLAGKPE